MTKKYLLLSQEKETTNQREAHSRRSSSRSIRERMAKRQELRKLMATRERTQSPSEGVVATDMPLGENQPGEQNDEKVKALLCHYLASHFVRKEGRFYQCENPTSSISRADFKRVALNQFVERFPDVKITNELWEAVFKHAVDDVHTDHMTTVAVWNGLTECNPGVASGTIWKNGTATLNSWRMPSYRSLGVTDADLSWFVNFVVRVVVHESDVRALIDWLAWTLQNESGKPGWVPLLYSGTKGTGKSTLVNAVCCLFGRENSITLNGISKLVGHFNAKVMAHKFVACEEMKAKPGTDAGNAIKSLVTESRVAVEGKGKEVAEIANVTAMIMTTNLYPSWIEPDDRRFRVMETNHSGHASGPDAESFQGHVKTFLGHLANPSDLARLYNALMQHAVSNDFNAHALNASLIDTPVMKRLHASSGEVIVQELREQIAASGTFAFPQSVLRRVLTEKYKVNVNRLPHFMNELGWNLEHAKWGGKDYARAIWVHPDYQVANGRVLGPNGYDEPVHTNDEEIQII